MINIPVNLLVSYVTKRIFDRPRPKFNDKLKYKPNSFRSREKNCSFPSGDAI